MSITGIPPSCFGSVFWTMIHQIAIAYPEYVDENDPIRNKIYNFYKSLEDVIPCRECQEHYAQNFPKLALENYLDSRKNLFAWTYNLHNIVNKQLGVTDYPTLEEAYERYDSLRTENCSQGTVGVCNSGSNEMYCKVEILSKNDKNKMSSGDMTTIIISIIFILIIIGIVSYFNFSKKRKTV